MQSARHAMCLCRGVAVDGSSFDDEEKLKGSGEAEKTPMRAHMHEARR